MFERKDKNGNVGTYSLGKSFILRELLPKEFYDKWDERDFAFERFQNDSSKTEKLDVLSKVHSELFTMAVHVNTVSRSSLISRLSTVVYVRHTAMK